MNYIHTHTIPYFQIIKMEKHGQDISRTGAVEKSLKKGGTHAFDNLAMVRSCSEQNGGAYAHRDGVSNSPSSPSGRHTGKRTVRVITSIQVNPVHSNKPKFSDQVSIPTAVMSEAELKFLVFFFAATGTQDLIMS